MGQAALPRRKNQSKRLYVAGPRGFGLCLVFPAEILSFLRGQAYQVLLIRASRAALRACPKAEACLFRMDFREIHRHPVKETSDFGQHVHLIPVSVLAQHEVSTMGVVADETIGLRTAIRGRLSVSSVSVLCSGRRRRRSKDVKTESSSIFSSVVRLG